MEIKKQLIKRNIGSDTILVPIGQSAGENNGLFVLTETAGLLWDNLPVCESEEELAEILFNEYEVTTEEALNDTRAFLDTLKKYGII